MKNVPLASRLIGKKIGRWEVIKKRDKTEEDNSGFFSTCYIVRDDQKREAFLKAYNYNYAFSRGMSVDDLNWMTENFKYERNILGFCEKQKMKRVVTAIDNGEYIEPGEVITVPYLVFEIAQGSLKTHQAVQNPSISWKLTTFHGALVGLSQLHRAKIVHQDIKPSNILIFGTSYSKISDLGSATQFNNPSNWGRNDEFAGDRVYAPIELLYRYFSKDWDTRRFGADIFMIGGILSFMLTGTHFLALILSKIPVDKHFMNYGGKFEEAKPSLLKAYYETLEEIEVEIPKALRSELKSFLAEFCHPIPEERGNPRNLLGTHQPYSLERYISIMDRLAKKAEYLKL